MKEKVNIFIERNKRNVVVTFITFIEAISVFVGYYYGAHTERARYKNFLESFKSIREGSGDYSFINPRVGGVSAPATTVGLYADINNDIIQYLNKEKKRGALFSYSFYFHDLSTGMWFGDSDTKGFIPASLFRLPIAIAAYKQSEKDPSFLQKKVVLTNEITALQKLPGAATETVLKEGSSYSIEYLIEVMLEKSDNGAKDLLLMTMDKTYLNQLFGLLSSVEPERVSIYEISSRKYSQFLRVLYNSSYINEENSEKVLKYLVEATFRDALVAGLPSNVPVAHKFGVFPSKHISVDGGSVNSEMLHDCGIIYHSTKPYIFCILTEGKDVPSLMKIIAEVSKKVFEYQEKNTK